MYTIYPDQSTLSGFERNDTFRIEKSNQEVMREWYMVPCR